MIKTLLHYLKVAAHSLSCTCYGIAKRVFKLTLLYDGYIVVAQPNLSLTLAQLNVSIDLRNRFFASVLCIVFRQYFERIFDFQIHDILFVYGKKAAARSYCPTAAKSLSAIPYGIMRHTDQLITNLITET